MTVDREVDHFSVGVLGLLTIVSFGSWYYAFGVLLDPIRLATGWSESALALSFSAGVVVIGLGSIAGGRMLDRFGSRAVFLLGGAGGSSGLLVASFAPSVGVFLAASAIGMGFLGSLGFYHITMSTAVRINPQAPKKAIAVLTIWGAFSSFIYLPATAVLVERFEWRTTVQIIAVTAAVTFLVAALVVPVRTEEPTEARSSLRSVLMATVATSERRTFSAAVGLGGIAMSTVLVYQVPTMTAAGLPLGTAATVAGIRGFCQVGGRIPLTPMIARLTSTGALALAFATIAVGGVLLAVAGTVPVAVAYAVVTGFGIGAFSPLQGIKIEELYDRHALGATMGFYSMVLMLSGSLGPATAGIVSERLGDRRVAAAIVTIAASGATLLALRLRKASNIPSAEPSV